MDLRNVSTAIQGYGPTEEQKRRLQETVFGSFLGLSAAALLSLLAYLAVVVTFYLFLKDELKVFADDDPWLFWPILLGPPALILVYLVIPASIRAHRERQI